MNLAVRLGAPRVAKRPPPEFQTVGQRAVGSRWPARPELVVQQLAGSQRAAVVGRQTAEIPLLGEPWGEVGLRRATRLGKVERRAAEPSRSRCSLQGTRRFRIAVRVAHAGGGVRLTLYSL